MNKAGYGGEVKLFQWYNFVNQMHWILAHGPQKSGYEGLREPVLTESKKVPKKIRDELNRWIQKVDKEYKYILEKHEISDQIVFVGKKK